MSRPKDAFKVYRDTVALHGHTIKALVDEWAGGVDFMDDKVIESKVQELIWASMAMYGIGGMNGGGTFQADFIM